jgi:hypothetical protein
MPVIISIHQELKVVVVSRRMERDRHQIGHGMTFSALESMSLQSRFPQRLHVNLSTPSMVAIA